MLGSRHRRFIKVAAGWSGGLLAVLLLLTACGVGTGDGAEADDRLNVVTTVGMIRPKGRCC